jgi:hypothetical protein
LYVFNFFSLGDKLRFRKSSRRVNEIPDASQFARPSEFRNQKSEFRTNCRRRLGNSKTNEAATEEWKEDDVAGRTAGIDSTEVPRPAPQNAGIFRCFNIAPEQTAQKAACRFCFNRWIFASVIGAV